MKRRERENWAWTQEQWVRELADYNAEVSRGIVHTKEWDERMARYQQQYDMRVRSTA